MSRESKHATPGSKNVDQPAVVHEPAAAFGGTGASGAPAVEPGQHTVQRAKVETDRVPSVGRIVHFVLPTGPFKGEHRAAIVVQTWKGDSTHVNLSVFRSQQADFSGLTGGAIGDSSVNIGLHQHFPASLVFGSVEYDETGLKPGTWHWPEFS